jgi:hypothetical protein
VNSRNFAIDVKKANMRRSACDWFSHWVSLRYYHPFFIFGKSETLKQFLISTGEFKKMTKAQQADLNRGFLNTRGYDKGVPHSSEETYQTDGTSWASESGIISGTKMRVRLSIEWTTLRYKRSVEFLNPNGTLKSDPLSRYGRCEEVSPDVRQKGNP